MPLESTYSRNSHKDEALVHDSSVKIVAEITNNHLGDQTRLLKMVELAKVCGADYIKVQKRDVLSFYSKEKLESPYLSPFGSTFRDYRLGTELSFEDLVALDRVAKDLGMFWFSSVLDQKSFEIIRKFNPSLIKIPSTISEHYEFHRFLCRNYQKDIVISTGFTGKDYERYILETFYHLPRVYLMQCTSAYPAPLDQCQIAIVRHYSKLSSFYKKICPGYSSHDSGSLASMLAVAAGAKLVEKHVKLDSTDWIHFDGTAMSLSNGEFESFCRDIRLAEKVCGNEEKEVMPSEFHKYQPVSSVRDINEKLPV